MAGNDKTNYNSTTSKTRQEPILDMENISVSFGSSVAPFKVVNDISLSVKPGETVALVGESGSGKSVTGMAVLGLHKGVGLVDGNIKFRRIDNEDIDLNSMSDQDMRNIRGNEIAMIFQDPMSSLNPVLKVSDQLTEVLYEHQKIKKSEANARALEMLELVGIPNAKSRMNVYPHEMSGGMRQRVMIAMALICSPRLLIADEPTTALDVTIQAQILDLLKSLQKKNNMGVVFITHDLGVVNEIADKVMVMYSGRIVEQGSVKEVMGNPKHPYTRGLMDSIPQMDEHGKRIPLNPIPGSIPSLNNPPSGCRFHPRCAHFKPDQCDQLEPSLETLEGDRAVRCVRWKEFNLSARVGL